MTAANFLTFNECFLPKERVILFIYSYLHEKLQNVLLPLSHSAAQCTHHHTCEIGRRLSQHDREAGLIRMGLPPVPSRDPTPPVMDNILQEVTAIRHFLEKRDRAREVAKEWLQVGYVLDVLLFRVYLVAMVAYSITLGTLWSVWQVA